MAVLGRVGLKAFLIAYGTLAVVELLAGVILNKTIKEDKKSDFIQELPPIRIPSPKAILKKTAYRIYWFFKEAVPIFFYCSCGSVCRGQNRSARSSQETSQADRGELARAAS